MPISNQMQTQGFSRLFSIKYFQFLGEKVQITHEELDNFVNLNSEKDGATSRWYCNLCGHMFSSKIDLTRHMESKHVSLPMLACELCGKLIKTRHTLRVHMKKIHNQIINFERGIQTQ